MKRRVWKAGKLCALGFCGLLLMLSLAAAGLLFTRQGLELVVWGARKSLPQLSVGGVEGAVFPGFALRQVAYRDGSGIEARAERITLSLPVPDRAWFSRPSVCVDEFLADGVTLSVPETPGAESSRETSAGVSLPVPVKVGRLVLNRIRLNLLGHRVSWKEFTSSAMLQDKRLTVGQTVWNDIRIEPAVESGLPESRGGDPSKAGAVLPAVLPEVTVPLTVDLTRFDLNRLTLVQARPVVVNHLGLEASAHGHDVMVRVLALDTPEMDARFSGTLRLAGDYPLDLKVAAAVKQAEAKGQTLDLQVSGSAAGLNLDARLAGLAEARIRGTVKALSPGLPFEISLEQARAQWPLTGQGAYFADIPNLNVKGSLAGYTLSLEGRFRGQGLPDTRMAFQGRGTLKQIDLSSVMLQTLGGTVSGQVSGKWETPLNWQAALALTDIRPGLQWPEAEGRISGRLKTSGTLMPSGGFRADVSELDINGVVRDFPLHLKGALTAASPGGGGLTLATPGVTLSHGPNRLTAKGRLDRTWDMAVAVNLPDLAGSVPGLKGRLNGRLALSGAPATPEIDLALDADGVDWQGRAGFSRLAVTLSGTRSRHRLTLSAVSDLGSIRSTVTGALEDPAGIMWQGQVTQARLNSKLGPWRLDRPVAVSVNGAEATIAPHCWRQDGAGLCLEKEATVGRQGAVALAADGLDLKKFAGLLPEKTGLDGQASARASVAWGQKLVAALTLTLSPGRVSAQSPAPLALAWNASSLKAELTGHRLEAAFRLDVADNGDVEGHLMIPDIAEKAPQVDGALKLSRFNLGFLAPLTGEDSRLNVDLNTDLTIRGALPHPQVFGLLLAEHIVAAGDRLPVRAEDGRLNIEFSGDRAELDGRVQTPDGVLNLAGRGHLPALGDWQADIRVSSDALKVDVAPVAALKLAPDVSVSLTSALARITGEVSVPWGRIEVAELPPSAVKVSGDQVILDARGEPVEKNTPLFSSLETNLRINIGEDVRLSAFGLKGKLSGQLKATQTDRGPFVVGEVKILKGSYKSLGQDLIIREGKIIMNGPVDKPYVVITAVRNPENTQDDVTAGIKVTGPADHPQVTLFSDPPLPQANALSYLLQGKDLGSASGGNNMTMTLIGLSLAKSGKVVGEIGQAFGVRDLQVDTSGSGSDSKVAVSGYILPGLKVKYARGFFDSVGEFTVRYRVMKSLYLEAVSGLSSAVDLLYRFEVE